MQPPIFKASADSPTAPAVVRLNDLTAVADRAPLLRENGLDSLDALFGVSHGESLHKPGLDSWRERFRLTLSDRGQPGVFYLKRFTSPPSKIQREVRKSGLGAASVAALEWTRMHELAGDGIACVKPIAFGEDIGHSRERRSAILTAAVPGRSLESFMAEWTPQDRQTLCRLSAPLAKLVSRFHNMGYIHRDLYLSHVFFDPTLPFDQALHLIDLQRVIRPTRLRGRWIVKDLACLDYSTPGRLVSRADRLRWLKHYLGVSKLEPRVKRLAYRIMGKTRQIAGHDRRRTARIQETTRVPVE